MYLKCKPTYGDSHLEQLWSSRSHCHSRKTGRFLSLQSHGGIYRICGRVERLRGDFTWNCQHHVWYTSHDSGSWDTIGFTPLNELKYAKSKEISFEASSSVTISTKSFSLSLPLPNNGKAESLLIEKSHFSYTFYAPEIEDWGHIVFFLSVILSFRHSVILFSSLKL